MKIVKVKIELLEKGDKVLLPAGEAVVVKDETPEQIGRYNEVKVKWITHKYKKGKTDFVLRADCILIKN